MPRILVSVAVCLGLGAVCLLPNSSRAQERLVVSTQGSVDALVREFIVPRMRDQGIGVSTTPSLSAPALAKALAQRSSPQIDLFMLDAGPWLQGKAAGLWADIAASEVPNLADVAAPLRDPKGVPYTHLVVGLLYDSKKVNPPPTGLRDLARAAFKGKISVPTFSSTFAFALLAALDSAEGSATPSAGLDAGFAALKRIQPNILSYYGSGAQLIDLFKQGEIEIAWGANHVAQGLGAASPVKWIAPAEGASLSTVYAAIAQGSTNVKAAQKFIDLLISPEFQALLAERGGTGYVNAKTRLTADFAATSPLTAELMQNGRQLPWEVFNANRVRLNERWQRELEAR